MNTAENLKRILLSEISGIPRNEIISLLLSGGIDSSLILALLREVRPEQEIHTFTVAGSHDYPDVVFARKIARLYKTSHHEIVPDIHDLKIYVSEFRRSQGKNSKYFRGNLSLFILCLEAKKLTDILVTGDGGDEIFGGYWLHSFPLGHRETGEVKSFDEIHPMPANHIAAMVKLGYRDFYFKEKSELKDYDAVWKYFADIMLKRHLEPLINITNSLNIKTYIPFWTNEVLEFIKSLDYQWRIGRKLEKALAFSYLPDEIVERESVGFDVALEGEAAYEHMLHQQISSY